MTTIIDHAINIPSPTQVVWALVSNPELFPRWQSDCQRVAFLTTQRRGKNTRLRCMGDSGKEYVMEISAWYEGLGYEYKIVDGGPYETNQGRIRLQEIAEGTVVQWTFSYSLAGVLGSLRNMGVRRAAENQVIDSLRNLYRFVRDSAGENNIKLIKSMMQDAPDVDQRATYTPRHPTQYDEERIRQNGGVARPVPVQRTTMRPIMDEPLPADDDTQRNRPVVPPAAASVEAPIVRPTPPQQPFAPYSQPSSPDTQYARPATNPTRPEMDPVRPPTETRRDYSTTIPPVTERPMPREGTQKYEPRPITSEQRAVQPPLEPPPSQRLYRPEGDMPPSSAARVNVDPLTTPPPLTPSPSMPPTILSRPSSTTIPPVTDRPPTTERPTLPERPPTTDRPVALERLPAPDRPTMPERPAAMTDTGRMSVFELFGLTKPSETQQMKPVAVDASGKPVITGTTPRVDPVPTPLTPSTPANAAEAKARADFQAGMPQTGDVNPEGIRQGWRALHRRQMLSLRRPTKPQ